MSRRGGRRGSDPRHDQESSTPSPSFHRGSGRGGGRGGRGRGRGARLPEPDYPQLPTTTVASYTPQTAPSVPPPARTPRSAQASTSSSSMVPETQQQAPSSSGSELQLGREMEQKLLLVPPKSSKMLRPPTRPGFGTVGTKIMVRANHFLVQIADRDLYHYDVTLTPELTSKKVSRDCISQLVTLYGMSHLGGKLPAYDGHKSLYTAGPLPFESKEFVVKLGEKDRGAASSSSMKKEREFKVAIKFAAKVDTSRLQQFLEGRMLEVPQEAIQILDTVLRMSPSQNYVVVGRSFFSPNLGQKPLGGCVEYWRGYYQSIRPTQMGLSFNIDVSSRSFFEPILVSEFVAKYLNVRDLSMPLSDQSCATLKRALKGIKVQITYGDCNRTYKITGLSAKPVNQTLFTVDDKKSKVSVSQYFRDRYNIVLKYPSLPALQAGSTTKPSYLPVELCKIVEGQRYTKKLNERQVATLLKETCQRPSEREGFIKRMVRHNGYRTDKLVRHEFGICVEEELALVKARVLPPPLLKYHATGREASVNPRLGQWNMIDKKMVNGGRVDFWACVNFSQNVRRDFPSEFCRQLVQMCISKGMEFNPTSIFPILSVSPSQIERTLVNIHSQSAAKLINQEGKYLQLLIIILPDASGSYGKIKRICETELGIVSQCCQPKSASRLSKQYLENVALKINVKVGGRNTVLNDAVLRRIDFLTDRPTIIFGADVTHPPAGEDFGPSIAAVVASMDWPEVTKYRGIVSAQAHRDEIIQDLYKSYQDPKRGLVHGGMIRELLIAFRRATGHKPDRIIFYRDGVSEGQFGQVLLYEMDAIWKACGSLEEGYLPPVTFIVVQKRHHTRLFPTDHGNRNLTDKSGNIQPGTVVDTEICHPTGYDFYLNSHAGIQGTSRPTHYHVLFDENNFNADALQMLTNNLCYTYARCTRSVSVVPPAYYAHLAAFRARYYIEGETFDGGSTGERDVAGRSTVVRPLPGIKENVKNVMFYC